MSDNVAEETGMLVRSITWKQGLFVALGVPILILPSLYDVAGYIWAFSIVMWTICVLQGFLQNTAYGEMVTTFPRAAGLPGCAQVVFTPENQTKKYDTGKLIGAFCAWCYWFAWTPVVAIFTVMTGLYLTFFVPALADFAAESAMNETLLNVALGIVIVSVMLLIGSRGLTGGSKFGLILAIIAIVPMVVILAASFVTGGAGGGALFDFGRITGEFLPDGWGSSNDIVLLFGCFALAQWSGCAWETAALYGPEYKEPNKDVPKALFACGFICLILYFFVSMAVFGSLGMVGIDDAGYATLGPIAEAVFGDIGGPIALTLLVAAMILIIQTGFLGSSRTLYYMAEEGNMPKFMKKQNKHGMPLNAMIVVSIFNLILIVTATIKIGDIEGGGPVMILAASGIGYCLAHVVALSAYVKSRTNARFKHLERPFSAPKGWKYVAAGMVFYELCVLIPCLMYWMYDLFDHSMLPFALAIAVFGMFFPIWYYTQNSNAKASEAEEA
ncbi:MAG: APC family permease [Methanomassiliicoccaceae archaeon]|nr:APC family permease [Methanomassiliicoccaceae archaeon]MCL2145643.1 APC family permease [Methanomassiliicoccaceae archaeon]